jgi:hypothetical protein
VLRARALVCAHFLSDWLAIEGVRRPACASPATWINSKRK